MVEAKQEFKEKVVYVGRVAKVVKGGRTFRFSVLVVVGDEKGRVGVGSGKASEVPEAIKKATEESKSSSTFNNFCYTANINNFFFEFLF